MTTDQQARAAQSAPAARAPYAAPRLKRYGSVAVATAAGGVLAGPAGLLAS